MSEGAEGLHIDERRLAAILVADVAGYSRLMGRNKEETVRDLEAHQAVILPLIATGFADCEYHLSKVEWVQIASIENRELPLEVELTRSDLLQGTVASGASYP
jgi:hypothetical protein